MTKRYYEIISPSGVIGVASEDSEKNENLLHICKHDRVIAFGVISEKDFDRYGDDDWETPISTEWYTPEIKQVLDLRLCLPIHFK